jgi:hypothetical protein
MAVRVAARLRLADHIAAGTQTTEALAAAVCAERDAHAARILRRCADAASETGKVLVVDHIGDAQASTPNTEGDLRMLLYFRGRERTLGQLRELAASAGLQLGSVTPAGSRSIIELRRARLA